MDAAFRLGSAAPAAGARIFIRRGPAGARHAPDRQVTRSCKRMRRQVGAGVDVLDRFARDVCEWIELRPGAAVLDDGNIGAQATLETFAPVDPRGERRQCALERLDLANAAAGVGV